MPKQQRAHAGARAIVVVEHLSLKHHVVRRRRRAEHQEDEPKRFIVGRDPTDVAKGIIQPNRKEWYYCESHSDDGERRLSIRQAVIGTVRQRRPNHE